MLKHLIPFLAADNIDTSKSKIEKAFTKRFKIVFWGLLALLISTFLVALYGTGIGRKQLSTYNISAVTEKVTVQTLETALSSWPVKDILVVRKCEVAPLFDIASKFTGVIQLNPGVTLELIRVGNGPLTVGFHSDSTTSGTLYDEEDEFYGELSACAYFQINDLKKRMDQGQTIVLPLTGEIIPGPELNFLSQPQVPILRSGRVSMLGKKYLSGQYYAIGPFTLDLGDSFRIKQPVVPSQGVVVIDETPAIKLVYLARGYNGVINRYQTGDFTISNSAWSRLYHDETLSYLWLGVVAMFGAARLLIRYRLK